MQAKHTGGIIFGIIMMFVAVMAFFSGEEASRTETGCCFIGGVFMVGLVTVIENLIKGMQDKSTTENTQTNVSPSTSVGTIPPQNIQPIQAVPSPSIQNLPSKSAVCPRCKKSVSEDYMICPYCGFVLKPKCPNCGKSVQADYAFCPFCKSPLQQMNNHGNNQGLQMQNMPPTQPFSPQQTPPPHQLHNNTIPQYPTQNTQNNMAQGPQHPR